MSVHLDPDIFLKLFDDGNQLLLLGVEQSNSVVVPSSLLFHVVACVVVHPLSFALTQFDAGQHVVSVAHHKRDFGIYLVIEFVFDPTKFLLLA